MRENLYGTVIHEDGSLDIPIDMDPEERLEILELGMGRALSTKHKKMRHSLLGIQKKVEDAKEIVEYQKALEEECYRQAKNASSNIIHLLLSDSNPPKYVPSKR